MNRHDETEDLFNEYMRNQEGTEDNQVYYEDEDGAVRDSEPKSDNRIIDSCHTEINLYENEIETTQDKLLSDVKKCSLMSASQDKKAKELNAFKLPHTDEYEDMIKGRKDTNDFMIFNDRRNTNELGELDIMNLNLNVFTDDILKSKKDDKNQLK